MELSKYIANHLPCKIVYYVGIRMWANATTKQYSEHDATSITMNDCIVRWGDQKR